MDKKLFRILEIGNDDYKAWIGTIDDIVSYLKEHDLCKNWDDSWIEGLEKIGLTFECIN